MKIDSQFIEEWEPKYDEIESDQGEYIALVKCVSEDIQNFQTIRLDTFERIINWKSPRSRGFIEWNNYETYQEAFRIILDPNHPEKMRTLDDLPGIGPPIASVILHFIYPEVFPMYDFRTTEVLYNFGYLQTKYTSRSHYPKFQDAIIKLKISLVHYNLRQIDRALFTFHKINSEKFKKLSEKKHKKCIYSQYINSKETSRSPAIYIRRDETVVSIPKIVQSICEELGAGGKIITRKDILAKTKQYGLNKASVLPADYCDNTKTGQWSKHSFLHSFGPGKYILSRFKEQKKPFNV